jgi:hypothetical protein
MIGEVVKRPGAMLVDDERHLSEVLDDVLGEVEGQHLGETRWKRNRRVLGRIN